MTYIWPRLSARIPTQRVMNVIILIVPSLVINTIYLVLFYLCLGVEKMIFIGKMLFHFKTFVASP